MALCIGCACLASLAPDSVLAQSTKPLIRSAPETGPASSALAVTPPEPAFQTAAPENLQARIKLGESYARIACQQCHVFPEPRLLDRASWQKYVLPKMKLYAGLSSWDQVRGEDLDLVRASGIVSPVPRFPPEYWGPITTYYLETAPEQALPQPAKAEVQVGLKQFTVEKPRFRRSPPLTTLVSVDSEEHRIYSADARAQSLDILGPDGGLLESVEVGNIPVALKKTERGLYLTCIGHFFPSERKQGQVILLEKTPQGYQQKVILQDLPRVSNLEFGDFNHDGKMDFVLSMFGYLTGRLSWFENLGADQYREHVLFAKAGAMQSIVHDFNGDGVPDIATLMGQESDGVILFENSKQKPGNFTSRDLIRGPPSFGPDYFELADFNKDGLPDLLVVNGDAADYPQPPKNYHGIRIFLNKGNGRFENSFFYPLNGAIKAVARDFDGDGDLDIAAIAFFPDYQHRPRETFVYLENQGDMKFTASTFPEASWGRWLTMDVGDVDGDGDLDIVLGSMTEMPGSPVPADLKAFWQTQGPSVLILKNRLH